MDPRSVVQHLFELPKFEAQKEFCRSLVEQDNLYDVLCEVIKQWDAIPPNRRDKFFYLVSLALGKVDYDILSIESTDLRNYSIRCLFKLDEKMVRYIAVCKHRSTLATIRESLKEADYQIGVLALELGKQRQVMQANREVLYEIYSLAIRDKSQL